LLTKALMLKWRQWSIAMWHLRRCCTMFVCSSRRVCSYYELEVIRSGDMLKIATSVRIFWVLSVSLSNWARKIVPMQHICCRRTYKNSSQNAAKLVILSSKMKNYTPPVDAPTATFLFSKKVLVKCVMHHILRCFTYCGIVGLCIWLWMTGPQHRPASVA